MPDYKLQTIEVSSIFRFAEAQGLKQQVIKFQFAEALNRKSCCFINPGHYPITLWPVTLRNMACSIAQECHCTSQHRIQLVSEQSDPTSKSWCITNSDDDLRVCCEFGIEWQNQTNPWQAILVTQFSKNATSQEVVTTLENLAALIERMAPPKLP